jgi:hypothetical protein
MKTHQQVFIMAGKSIANENRLEVRVGEEVG